MDSEADHIVTIEGPIPYFDTPVIYFAVCSCGKYRSTKCTSEGQARSYGKCHVRGKTQPHPANRIVGSKGSRNAIEGTPKQSE